MPADVLHTPCPEHTTTRDGRTHHCWGKPGHDGKHHAPIDLGDGLGVGKLEWSSEPAEMPDDRCAHTMTDGEGALYRCIDKAGHAGAHSCAPVDAHPAQSDAYAASLERDQAVKAALDSPLVVTASRMLGWEAQTVLAAAGIDGMRVHVKLWVSYPGTGCRLVIASPGG